MNILITGGAGFVGSNLCVHLKKEGHAVTVMDNLVRRGSELNLPRIKESGANFLHGDVRAIEDFAELRRIDVVLHCAAQPSAVNYANPVFDVTNNTIGTLNILEFCRNKGAGLIFWSTNKCYTGEITNSLPYEILDNRFIWSDHYVGFDESTPIGGKDHSIYGVSKVCADLLIQEWADAYDVPSIINRFSCLAGPYQWGKAEQGWVAWFVIAKMLELPISVYGYEGLQVRDYLFTPDINSLISKQLGRINNYRGEVFNIGGGLDFTVSVKELIKKLEIEVDAYYPGRRADQAIYITDNHKAKIAFDWAPLIKLDAGIVEIQKWVSDYRGTIELLYGKSNETNS